MILTKRYERAVDALNQNSIDAWLLCGRETNILGEPGLLYLMPFEAMGRVAVLITKAGEHLCICGAIESEEAADSGLFNEVVVHRGFEAAIARELEKRLPISRIALDISENDPSSDGLTHSDYIMLTRCFAAAGFDGEIVSSDCLMKQIRGRKSVEEVKKIAHTVSEAMKIYEEARPQIRLGLSGRDVQGIFQELIRAKRYGFSWYEPGNPYVSIGARSSYNCRRPPADVYIEPGDLVNVDLGVRIDGFASDNQRSFYALRPDETAPPYEVQHAWETIQRMNREVCAAMRVGVDSNDLTEIGNQVMVDQGYPEGWQGGYGHELGLFAHNGGIGAGRGTRQGLDTTLEENMTFTLEPAILTSHGRLCQEEIVCVTNNGGKMLSTPQSEIWLIRG
ncbi:peptidase M24 [Clostridia bacterium]|nr:peptidase M24 [Clostridia bacterium]